MKVAVNSTKGQFKEQGDLRLGKNAVNTYGEVGLRGIA